MRLSSGKKPDDISWDLFLITAITTTTLLRVTLSALLADPAPTLWTIPVLISYGLILLVVWKQNGEIRKLFWSIGGGLAIGHMLMAAWLSSRFEDLPFNLAFQVSVPHMLVVAAYISTGVVLVVVIQKVFGWTNRGGK